MWNFVAFAEMSHNWDHTTIANHLLAVFHRDFSYLLLLAGQDDTRRHNLTILLDYEKTVGQNPMTGFGGTVNYNKKKRCFDFIQYCDHHGYAVRISIIAPGVYWSAWEHRNYLYHNVPEFYHPEKKLAQWLLSH